MSTIEDVDWALIVDILAREYSWTIDYIKTLDYGQICTLVYTITERYKRENEEVESNTDSHSVDKEDNLHDFIIGLKGKKHIREDGTTEIIV